MYDGLEISPGGVLLPRIKPIVPRMGYMPTRHGAELLWDEVDKDIQRFWDKFFKLKDDVKQRMILMTGSLSNYSSKKIQDILFGATAYTAVTPLLFGLWSAAIDDTSTGALAGESAYGSYARLSLTNNTTIFAAGSGTTTYTKTFPSDAAKNFVTSTATGTNNTITYLFILDGAGAANGIAWCSVTSTTINTGDTPQLAINAITVTQD